MNPNVRWLKPSWGGEELTKDIPNVSENELSKLTSDGIVMIGATVNPNDILVGKIEPRGEKELSAEERLLRAIFGEKPEKLRTPLFVFPTDKAVLLLESMFSTETTVMNSTPVSTK